MPTVYGIGTPQIAYIATLFLYCYTSTYRLRYWNVAIAFFMIFLLGCNRIYRLRYEPKGARQQRSDDEVRTSQVPERSEGKTKEIKQQYSPFTVLKLCYCGFCEFHNVFPLQQYLPFTVYSINSSSWFKSVNVKWIGLKFEFNRNDKNHGICRGFLFPSFSDYFVRAKPHIM